MKMNKKEFFKELSSLPPDADDLMVRIAGACYLGRRKPITLFINYRVPAKTPIPDHPVAYYRREVEVRTIAFHGGDGTRTHDELWELADIEERKYLRWLWQWQEKKRNGAH